MFGSIVLFFIFIDDYSMTSSNDSIFIFPFKIQYNWKVNECKDEEEKKNHATDDVVVDAILYILWESWGRIKEGKWVLYEEKP